MQAVKYIEDGATKVWFNINNETWGLSIVENRIKMLDRDGCPRNPEKQEEHEIFEQMVDFAESKGWA